MASANPSTSSLCHTSPDTQYCYSTRLILYEWISDFFFFFNFFYFKCSCYSSLFGLFKNGGCITHPVLVNYMYYLWRVIWPLGGVGEKRIWKYTFWECFICKFKDAQIFYSMGANFFRTEHWRFQNILSMFFSFSRNKSKKFEKVEICSLKFAWFDNYFGFFLSSLVAVRK